MMVYFGTKYDVRRRTSGRQGVKVMTTRLGKAASFKRKAAAWLAAVAITLGCGTTAFANNSPENDYETDSTHILISEADTTIADIDNLMLGDAPSEVLGDKSLDGYSTLAVFSVTAVNDYDYSEIETTKIRGAAITSDMTVQVRFLPDDGDWTKIPFSVESGVLLAEFPSDGQLAVFVKDDIDIPDDDDPQTAGVSQAGKAPQTGDRLPIYIFTGIVAATLVVVSVRKIRK